MLSHPTETMAAMMAERWAKMLTTRSGSEARRGELEGVGRSAGGLGSGVLMVLLSSGSSQGLP